MTIGKPVRLYEEVEAYARSDADYAAALDIVGRTETVDAFDVYKVFELLRRSAGGKDESFCRRAGWTDAQLNSFSGSLNRHDVLGVHARHAVAAGDPPRRTMTLNECRDAILRVMRQWPESA